MLRSHLTSIEKTRGSAFFGEICRELAVLSLVPVENRAHCVQCECFRSENQKPIQNWKSGGSNLGR
jgi:hypothetical protein